MLIHVTCLYIAFSTRFGGSPGPKRWVPEGFSGSSCRLKLQHHEEQAEVR